MIAGLREHSIGEPTCGKCGRKGAETTYMPPGQVCLHSPGVVEVRDVERLHRRCVTCGYAWDEATLDQGLWAFKLMAELKRERGAGEIRKAAYPATGQTA